MRTTACRCPAQPRRRTGTHRRAPARTRWRSVGHQSFEGSDRILRSGTSRNPLPTIAHVGDDRSGSWSPTRRPTSTPGLDPVLLERLHGAGSATPVRSVSVERGDVGRALRPKPHPRSKAARGCSPSRLSPDAGLRDTTGPAVTALLGCHRHRRAVSAPRLGARNAANADSLRRGTFPIMLRVVSSQYSSAAIAPSLMAAGHLPASWADSTGRVPVRSQLGGERSPEPSSIVPPRMAMTV